MGQRKRRIGAANAYERPLAAARVANAEAHAEGQERSRVRSLMHRRELEAFDRAVASGKGHKFRFFAEGQKRR